MIEKYQPDDSEQLPEFTIQLGVSANYPVELYPREEQWLEERAPGLTEFVSVLDETFGKLESDVELIQGRVMVEHDVEAEDVQISYDSRTRGMQRAAAPVLRTAAALVSEIDDVEERQNATRKLMSRYYPAGSTAEKIAIDGWTLDIDRMASLFNGIQGVLPEIATFAASVKDFSDAEQYTTLKLLAENHKRDEVTVADGLRMLLASKAIMAPEDDDTPELPQYLAERLDEGVYDRHVAVDVLTHLHRQEPEEVYEPYKPVRSMLELVAAYEEIRSEALSQSEQALETVAIAGLSRVVDSWPPEAKRAFGSIKTSLSRHVLELFNDSIYDMRATGLTPEKPTKADLHARMAEYIQAVQGDAKSTTQIVRKGRDALRRQSATAPRQALPAGSALPAEQAATEPQARTLVWIDPAGNRYERTAEEFDILFDDFFKKGVRDSEVVEDINKALDYLARVQRGQERVGIEPFAKNATRGTGQKLYRFRVDQAAGLSVLSDAVKKSRIIFSRLSNGSIQIHGIVSKDDIPEFNRSKGLGRSRTGRRK
ncbi:MAG TPA: hypothetical protein VK983_04050 [Candidatus Limnocylindrales bacterium]|nr:hypothetical protein [Candidatus Limnocylindrales bacterium]